MRQGRRPTAKPLLSRLLRHARDAGLLAPGMSVLAAVSGGADSVCLAHWLCAQKARGRIARLALVHFNHGLRGRPADLDERLVRSLARSLGAELFTERLAVRRVARTERRSLEDAGRALRYRALARLARREGFGAVALGHHLDDNAETVLLHLLRGTKAEGLGGIPVSRPLPGSRARVIRPLLALTRAETRLYCRAFGVRWREDASNGDEAMTRNWVRRRLLPLLETRSPRVREHLAALAGDLRAKLRS